MDEHRRERLVELMAQMAAGDKAGIFALADEFGAQLAAALRRQLAHVGVHDVARDDLDGLVIDSCMALFDCARAWDPAGGALPWVWAERRLGALVTAHVGQHHDELCERMEAEATASGAAAGSSLAGGEPDPLTLLEQLARGSDATAGLCRLVVDALEHLSVRDRHLLLEVLVQSRLGDRAPSVTAGALHGVNPAAARQAVKRARDRLRDLAAREPRFAPLVDLPMLAA